MSESQPDRHAASRAKPSQQPHQASSLAQGRADKDKTCRHSPTALPRNLSKRQLALQPPCLCPSAPVASPLVLFHCNAFFSNFLDCQLKFWLQLMSLGHLPSCPFAQLAIWSFGRLSRSESRLRLDSRASLFPQIISNATFLRNCRVRIMRKRRLPGWGGKR